MLWIIIFLTRDMLCIIDRLKLQLCISIKLFDILLRYIMNYNDIK